MYCVTLDLLFKDHHTVVMTGGSGLYIKAVCQGMDELPVPEPGLREKIRSDYEQQGIQYLQGLLKKLDPGYYTQVDLMNPNRLMRAIEVSLTSGKPYSLLRKGVTRDRDFGILKFGIDMPREELRQRIHTRVDQMMADGLEEEARGLYQFRDLNALNTVGYKEMFRYFENEISLDEAVETIKAEHKEICQTAAYLVPERSGDFVADHPAMIREEILNSIS